MQAEHGVIIGFIWYVAKDDIRDNFVLRWCYHSKKVTKEHGQETGCAAFNEAVNSMLLKGAI